MEQAGVVMMNMLFIGLLCAVLGMACGNCIGAHIGGMVLAGIGMTIAMMGAVFFGAMLMLHALDGATTATVHDGRNDIIVTLKLGPFSYSRTIRSE